MGQERERVGGWVKPQYSFNDTSRKKNNFSNSFLFLGFELRGRKLFLQDMRGNVAFFLADGFRERGFLISCLHQIKKEKAVSLLANCFREGKGTISL